MHRVLSHRRKWLEATQRREQVLVSADTRHAATALQQFLEGNDGKAAIDHLLRVTQQHIVFGQTTEIHPFRPPTIYILRGGICGGLYRVASTARDGIPRIEEVPIRAEEAVEAAITYGNKLPHEILPWLIAELEKIADSIP